MTLIKDLPISEKPREKALTYGFESLSNAELMALILRHGYRNHSSIEVSQNVINKANGIDGLAKLSLKQLMEIKGIKEAKALELKAAFELGRRMTLTSVINLQHINSPKLLVDWLKYELGDKIQEEFLVIFLDSKLTFRGYKSLFKGTINASMIYQRDIITWALEFHASNVFLVHNHPSNNIEPSKADIEATRRVKEALRLVEINVLDHIIVSINNYYSFAEHGLIV